MNGIITAQDIFMDKSLPMALPKTNIPEAPAQQDYNTYTGEVITKPFQALLTLQEKSCLLFSAKVGGTSSQKRGKLIFALGGALLVVGLDWGTGYRALEWGVVGDNFKVWFCYNGAFQNNNGLNLALHYTEILSIPSANIDPNTQFKAVINFKNEYAQYPIYYDVHADGSRHISAYFTGVQLWVKFENETSWRGGETVGVPEVNPATTSYGTLYLNVAYGLMQNEGMGCAMPVEVYNRIKYQWNVNTQFGFPISKYWRIGVYGVAESVTLHWATSFNITNTTCFDALFSRRIYFDVGKIGE